jgi:hypothetical protein
MPQKTERFHINQLVNREERLAICSADCIVGEDVATGETEVVFGPEALEQEECTKVMIQLDLEAQLAYLGLVVTVLKGHWCYHGETFYGCEAQPPASQVLCVDEQEGVSFHMPATQLAPGMVRLRDDATGEDCWVDRSDEDRPATADLHESFDPEDDRQKQMLWNLLFEENSPMIEYWEQALRDEPKESMSDELKETWLFMARCFRHLTGNADLSGNEKADILEVIGVTILNGEEGGADQSDAGPVHAQPRRLAQRQSGVGQYENRPGQAYRAVIHFPFPSALSFVAFATLPWLSPVSGIRVRNSTASSVVPALIVAHRPVQGRMADQPQR